MAKHWCSVRMALEAGVMSVEHGFVIDKPTMKMLVKKGAYLSAQLTATGLPPVFTPATCRRPERIASYWAA